MIHITTDIKAKQILENEELWQSLQKPFMLWREIFIVKKPFKKI
jgi:hypothetical protein